MTDLQKALFNLIYEFDAICRKHNIVYYLDGGTNLGALRHEGFIPWDDDADVCIARSEFQKLEQIIDSELKDNRAFVTQERYNGHGSPIARYIDKDSTYLVRSTMADGVPHGISIDIIILDPMPVHEPALTEWKKLHYVYCELIEYTREVCSSVRQRDWEYIDEDLYLEYAARSEKVGRNRVLRELEEKLFNVDEEEAVDYCSRFGIYGLEIHPIEWYGKPREAVFEDAIFYIADKAEWCACSTYGVNWMNILPKEERENHILFTACGLPCGNCERESFQFIARKTVIDTLKNRKAKRMPFFKMWHETYFDRYKPYMAYLTKKMDQQFELYGRNEIKSNLETADIVFKNYMELQFSLIMLRNEYYVPIREIYSDIFIEYVYRRNRIHEGRLLLKIWEQQRGLSDFQKEMKDKLEDAYSISMLLDVHDYDSVIPLINKYDVSAESFLMVKAEIMAYLAKAKSRKDYDALEKSILRQLDRYPGNGELYKLYGDVLMAKNNKRKARAAYDVAADILENGVMLLELAKMGIEKAAKKVRDEDDV